MKRILKFENFINEEEKKDFGHLPRLKQVVDKEFFAELKQHIFYWVNYDFLNEKYELTSVEATPTEVTCWLSDKSKNPLHEYKITYAGIDGNDPKVEKIELVNMMIWIYEFETHELLTHTEMEVGLKYLNAESFNNFLNKVKKRIIKTPKDGEDIKNFKKKETRRLGDNIY